MAKFCKIPKNKYGSLRVIGFSHRHNRVSYWRVQCTCGRMEIKSLTSLEKPVSSFWKMCNICRCTVQHLYFQKGFKTFKPGVIDWPIAC